MRDGPRNIVASVWEFATTLAKAIVDPSRACVRVFKLGKQLSWWRRGYYSCLCFLVVSLIRDFALHVMKFIFQKGKSRGQAC